jgi:predicted amidohydrolase
VSGPLVIAVAQPRCTCGDVAANVSAQLNLLRSAGARVVLFPELSLTGYELEAPVLAGDDEVLAPLVQACAEAGSIALVGAPVPASSAASGGSWDGSSGGSSEGGLDRAPGASASIGVLAVDENGVRVAYRKQWLGEAEAVRFVPGPAPAVIEVDGWRLGLAVCKDTGVPQHAADTAALGIDAYLAGVLEHAEQAQVTDQRAVRIATGQGVWVAVASFAGSTGGGYHRAAGRSAIWRPDGTMVARAGSTAGSVVRARLSR